MRLEKYRGLSLNVIQKNYMHLRQVNAEIADACLIGSITFDAEQSRLIKTYAKGLRPEPDREYLLLQQPADLKNNRKLM